MIDATPGGLNRTVLALCVAQGESDVEGLRALLTSENPLVLVQAVLVLANDLGTIMAGSTDEWLGVLRETLAGR